MVLVKQFQPPKPYTGASSWKGYREYFERLATVNGWTTTEQKTEQLALALEGPASEVLRDLDTSQPQAYSLVWEALARRFGSLDGAREAMRRFDSRRQEENDNNWLVQNHEILNKPSVLYTVRLGLPLPQNSGMQPLSLIHI